MQSILFLCHRIPYPPNKGDKIRSYNILKFLSQYYRVHLGAFVDDPNDFQYENALKTMCESQCLLPLNPMLGKIKSLKGLLQGSALGLPYYANKTMQRWVNTITTENHLAGALVFSSTMAQYLIGTRFTDLNRYIDFIDIDSDKWAQYESKASYPMKMVYGYEAKMLFAWEKKVASQFDKCFFVSEKEAELFKKLVPDSSDKITYFNNGVDTEYFSPNHVFESPYPDTSKVLVFTGMMDYWANVDAVVWFAKEVLPLLQKKIHNIKFYIVGAKPDDAVRALAESEAVVVTGKVPDVRPFLSHASLAVAPMRIARGIQNKVLEAMAMALPTVTSLQGYEGINAVQGEELKVVNDVAEWVSTLEELLMNEDQVMGPLARRRVVSDYSWNGSLAPLLRTFESTGITPV